MSSWKPNIWVKTRRNYNETVIFWLYFKVIIELFQSQSFCLFIKSHLGFSGWHYSEYVLFYILSSCQLVLVFGLRTPVRSFPDKVSITRSLWKFNIPFIIEFFCVFFCFVFYLGRGRHGSYFRNNFSVYKRGVNKLIFGASLSSEVHGVCH